jgi:hypothetical protein
MESVGVLITSGTECCPHLIFCLKYGMKDLYFCNIQEALNTSLRRNFNASWSNAGLNPPVPITSKRQETEIGPDGLSLYSYKWA